MTDADQPVRSVSRRELMEDGIALGATAVASQYAVGGVVAQSGGPSDVISGTVTDESGNVDGATVVAVPHDESLDPLVTMTASDGTYSFEELDLHGGENLYNVIARDGTETSPRRGQENYPFIAAEGIDIPDSGLIHSWQMDEGSGTTVADNTGSADGTLTGAGWGSDSSVEGGQYTAYDGVDDYGSIPDQSSFNHTSSFTIRIAVYLTTVSNFANFMTKGRSHGPNDDVEGQYGLLLSSSSELRGEVYDDESDRAMVEGSVPNTSEWYELGLRYNDSTGDVHLFVDGSSSDSSNLPGTPQTTSNDIMWGRDGVRDDFYLDGRLDYPLMWNRALDDSEMSNVTSLMS